MIAFLDRLLPAGFYANLALIVTALAAAGLILPLLTSRAVILRHGLQRVALVSLLFAPLIAWLSWQHLAIWKVQTASSESSVSLEGDGGLRVTGKDLLPEFPEQLVAPMESMQQDVAVQSRPVPGPPPSRPPLPWRFLLLAGWTVGTLLVVARCFGAHRRAQRLRQGSEECRNEAFTVTVRGAAARLGLRSAPQVAISASLPAPVALGPWRRLLVIPSHLLGQLRPDERDAIVLHELAHFHYRHHEWALGKWLVRALLWWNPLVHRLISDLSDSEEEVCDLLVRQHQGGGLVLAELLVSFAEKRHAALAGIGFLRSSGFERRIKNLLHPEDPMTTINRLRGIAIATCFLLAVGASSVLGFRRASPEPAPQSDAGAQQRAAAPIKIPQQTASQQTEIQQPVLPPQAQVAAADPGQQSLQQLPAQAATAQERGEPSDVAQQQSARGQSGQLRVESFRQGRQVKSNNIIRRTSPPSITYGSTRASKTWVKIKGNDRVAVDEGVEWQGVRVYLSLTWDLVAVDAKTRKTLWSQHVSAFWDRVDFTKRKNKRANKYGPSP